MADSIPRPFIFVWKNSLLAIGRNDSVNRNFSGAPLDSARFFRPSLSMCAALVLFALFTGCCTNYPLVSSSSVSKEIDAGSERYGSRQLLQLRPDSSHRNWALDADAFIELSGDVRKRRRQRRYLPYRTARSEGPRSVEELFPCRWKPLNVPLPYQWFCRNSSSGVSIEGPDGPMETTHLGQVLGTGPHIYSFKPNSNGIARILHDGQLVDTFESHMDQCSCPMEFSRFLQEYTCSMADMERFNKLFSHWLQGTVTRKIMDDYWERPPFGTSTHVAIINNQVYYRHVQNKKWGWSWNVFVELISSVVRKVRLPDIEFYAHNADWPQSSHIRVGPPLFGFTTDSLHSDIPMPTGDHIKEAFRGEALRGVCKARRWDERERKAYFRGDNTGDEDMKHKDYLFFHPRFRAAMLSNQRPDLLDAKVFVGHGWKIDPEAKKWADEKNLTVPHKLDPRERPWDFKYALDLDGFSSPFRTSYLMAGGSLLLKQVSPYQLYFYDELEHGVNALDIDFNLRDLIKTIKWANKNPVRSRRIAEEGFRFYWNRLRQEDILCWMARALYRVSKAQNFKPEIARGMTKMDISTSSPTTSSCSC